LKNAHLRRCPHPSSLRSLQFSAGTSLLRISGALHLGIFEQPAKNDFSSNLLENSSSKEKKDLLVFIVLKETKRSGCGEEMKS
jgi:hypothetical protein